MNTSREIQTLQKGQGWQPDEKLFLLNNFYNKTNQELTDHINNYRSVSGQLTHSGVRHKCKGLGLRRSIQIRWSKKDIKKLKAWYKFIGDVEIAKMLNKVGNSYRKINGKIIKRKFTKKHVEKKRSLLKLKRTHDQVQRIINDNGLLGANYTNNWINGKRIAAKEKEIRIWNGGYRRRVIKINGCFIPYTRWFYINNIGTLADNEIVYHIDMDSLNDEPLNLKTQKRRRLNREDYKKALQLLNIRIKKLHKNSDAIFNCPDKKIKKQYMSELIRLQSLTEKINHKLK